MDEIEYKLKTKNAVLVVSAIEMLIDAIEDKFKKDSRRNNAVEIDELILLREKCSSEDTIISLTACRGLLSLVENGILEIAKTMSTMISILPTAKNFSAVTSTIAGLLLLDLKSRISSNKVYMCPFSLKTPQHPFITVIEKNPEAVTDVLSQMQAICNGPEYCIVENSLELLRPVFLWLMCNPQVAYKSEWRRDCWQLLLSLHNHKQQPALVLECLVWQQTHGPLGLDTFSTYSTVMEQMVFKRESQALLPLLLCTARVSTHFINNGLDPRPCYTAIDRCFEADIPQLRVVADCILILLSDNIAITPVLYLHDVLALCYKVITKFDSYSISLNVLMASLLQWVHYPSCLSVDALKVATKIIQVHDEGERAQAKLNMPTLYANPIFQSLKNTDERIFQICELCKLWERMREDRTRMNQWLDIVEQCNKNDIKQSINSILLGMFMYNGSDETLHRVSLRAFKVILENVKVRKDMTVLMLPVVLYKLSHSTLPEIQMACLKAIPLMASSKENVPTIIAVLNKIKQSRGVPQSLLIHLYTDLVDVQLRCYPYLQELLAESKPTVGGVDLLWEIEIAKAASVKQICETRASIHGAELVSVLSSILNRCNDQNGAMASSLALEALRALWHEHIVAPHSTWNALAPKMKKDKRPKVHVSLCKLLAEVPALKCETPEYDKFITNAVEKLWGYVVDSVYPEVRLAALEALSYFNVEDMTLRMIPEIFRQGIKLPDSYCKTPIDAARKPEDVLEYVPCEVWPNVFNNVNYDTLPGVRKMCCAYMAREIKAYRSGVYQPDGHVKGEPTAITYLPATSVVRGMLNFVQKQASHPTYDCVDVVLLEMMQCLTENFDKPLPPLDFCFLHNLFHRGAHFKHCCLLLGARQALVSGSAKRFTENYLASFDSNEIKEDDMIVFFEILPALARSIPPNALRTPLETCLNQAYTVMKAIKAADTENVNDVMFVRILGYVKTALVNEKINEANHTLLSQIIENYLTVLDVEDLAWPAYVDLCSMLPMKYLERMTSPSSWWEVSSELIRKATGIRSKLACDADSDTPLVWLNEVIDAAIDSPGDHQYVLRHICPAFKLAKADSIHTKNWLLELMARTQVAIVDPNASKYSLTFLCDIFLISVLMFSGYYVVDCNDDEKICISRDLRLNLFPNAVYSLVSEDRPDDWKNSSIQVTEWLHRTRTADNIPAEYRKAFNAALIACRHTKYFKSIDTWTGILSAKMNF